jgi:hypothetical protein
LDQVDDFARSYEIVGGLWVRFIVGNAVVEGGVVVDKVVLDHSREAMMHLTVGQAGMEPQSRESQSFVSLQSGKDALQRAKTVRFKLHNHGYPVTLERHTANNCPKWSSIRSVQSSAAN